MASSRSLGVLTLDLALRAGAFTAGLDKAARDTNKKMSEIEKRAYAFGKNLGTAFKAGPVLATAALTAVAVAVGQAINRADEIRDLSIRIGIGTEALSEYAYAAKQTGTDIEGLGRGLKILSKNLAEAADPKSGKGKLFEALGVEVKDAAGNLKQLDVILPEIANKFKLLEDGTTKAALAQELFGKSGLELTEFLNLGSEGLDEMALKARSLGIVISEETAASADQFNDKLADLRSMADGFSLELAAGLLPALNLTAERFEQLVKNGDLARNAISLFSGVLDFGVGILEGYNNAVARTSIAMEFLLSDIRDLPEAYRNAQNQLDQLTASQARSAAIAANNANLPSNFSAGSRRRGGPTPEDIAATKAAASAAKEQLTNEERLSRLFSTGGRAASKGKTDKSAERAAERLEKAIRQMTDAQREWQTELDGTGNKVVDDYAKRLDEITEKSTKFADDGIPKDKIASFREEMTKLAEALKTKELLEFSQDFAEGTAQIGLAIDGVASPALIKYQKDVRELDKVLKSGAISQKEYQDRLAALGDERNSQAINIRKDLEFEKALLGESADAQERLTLARQLGADAATEQGQAAIKALKDFQEAAELQNFIDDTKAGLGDMFVDFISGAKSAKEAFGDFADDLFRRALQFVADKAIQALFDSFKTDQTASGGSAAGGGWAALFGNLMSAFGGGRAGGGSVLPGKFYRVNESGMEMATVDGRDYLMTGSQSGMITPASKVGGAVYNLNNTFIVPRGEPQRTQQQQAQKMGQQVQEITRRNG